MRTRTWHSGLICVLALSAGCSRPGSDYVPSGAQAVAVFHEEQVSQIPRDEIRVLDPAALSFARALGDYTLGLALESEPGKAEESLSAYLRAARAAPERHEPLVGAARVLLRLGRPRESLDKRRKAVTLKTDDVRLWAELATIEELNGFLENAAAAYERTIAIEPTNTQWHVHSVRINAMLDRYEAALDGLRRGARDSRHPDAMARLALEIGRYLLAGKAPLGALPFFEFFIECRPAAELEVRLSVGEVFQRLGLEDAAIAQYRLAIDAAPSHPAPRIRLTAFLVSLGKLDEGIAVLEDGISALSDHVGYVETVAFLHTLDKNYEAALRHYDSIDRLLAARGNDTADMGERFYQYYAISLEKSGRIDDAEAVLARGVEALPESHSLLNHLAYFWAVHNRQLDRALDLINKALEAEPENGAYIDTLGWIFYRQHRYEEALAEIKRARRILGDDPVILDHLGDVFDALGNEPAAIEHWRLSFQADPTAEVRAKLEKRGIVIDAIAAPSPEKPPSPEKAQPPESEPDK